MVFYYCYSRRHKKNIIVEQTKGPFILFTKCQRLVEFEGAIRKETKNDVERWLIT